MDDNNPNPTCLEWAIFIAFMIMLLITMFER